MVPELNSGLAQRVSRPRFPSPPPSPLRTLGPDLYDTQQPPALDLTRRLRLSRTSTRLAPRTAPPRGREGAGIRSRREAPKRTSPVRRLIRRVATGIVGMS